MANRAGIACGAIVGIVFLLFLAYSLFLIGIAYSTQSVYSIPLPTLYIQPLTVCRVRLLNTKTLPLPLVNNMKRKAKLAVSRGVFDNVDIVLFQEMFRLFDGQCGIKEIMRAKKGLQGAVTEVGLPSGKFTDSGLAAVAVHPWQVRFVAFLPFSDSKGVDKWALKGVSVFEVYPVQLRFATTHMQASYKTDAATLANDDALRIKQFAEAVQFAVLHGAVLLGGDVNVSTQSTLEAFSNMIGPKGKYIEHDNKPTCCKQTDNGAYHNEQARIDHAWVLDTSKITPISCVTNDSVSDGLSDHAGLDIVLHVKMK